MTPDIVVERAAPAGSSATIDAVTWRRLRCLIEVTARGGAVTADLRLERASGPSVVAAPKPVEADGSASLVLAGDEHEGAALVLVMVDESGRVLAQRPTRVGENS